MQLHEFYGTFANTPLNDRFTVMGFHETGLDTLADIYKRIHELDEEMRPKNIEINNLIKIAERFWERKKQKINKLYSHERT